MADPHEALLVDAAVRASAVRDLVSILLAGQARASDDPPAFLRRISDALDERLAHGKAKEAHLGAIEQTRREYDWMLETARIILSETPPGPTSQ